MLGKLTLAALLFAEIAAAAGVSIHYENGVFRVSGLDSPAEKSSFTVTTGPGNPPLFGAYTEEHGELTFRPRYPLEPGVTYFAKFGEAVLTVSIPKQAGTAPTRVLAMYPSSPTLPANQLKLYLVFSGPMQGRGLWTKIHLIDNDGPPPVLPFVELDPELWNGSFTRVTLLFDPGRIKRGVKPNVDMGPVLIEGHHYNLVIDRDLKDANGNPLAEEFRHEFTVGPAERRGIDPKLWRLSEPHAGAVDLLVVRFDRPLDYALLGDSFQIPDAPGTATIGSGETEWRFQPSQPWTAGEHNLIISMALEDLAGNRIGRPFDVDELTNPAPRITAQTTSLTFRVPAAR